MAEVEFALGLTVVLVVLVICLLGTHAYWAFWAGGNDAFVQAKRLDGRNLRLAESGVLVAQSSIRHVIGLWRTPDRVAASASWPDANTILTDVYLFGEIGLFGARRLSDGSPAPIMPGPFSAPRSAPENSCAGDGG